jgi:hypothetical protein
MKITPILLTLNLMVLPLSPALAGNTNTVDRLLSEYQQSGATTFSAEAGHRLWQNTYPGKAPYAQRSCSTCHGKDLNRSGQHVRTKKTIDAMAPSVNSERLTDIKKVRKWLKRNCKWTVGRECTAQEKADVLAYLSSL